MRKGGAKEGCALAKKGGDASAKREEVVTNKKRIIQIGLLKAHVEVGSNGFEDLALEVASILGSLHLV